MKTASAVSKRNEGVHVSTRSLRGMLRTPEATSRKARFADSLGLASEMMCQSQKRGSEIRARKATDIN